ERVAVRVSNGDRQGCELARRRGAEQCLRCRTSNRRQGVAQLESADVNHTANDSREATLISIRRAGIVTGIDGGAAAKERVGEGWSSIILKRAKPKVGGCEVGSIRGLKKNIPDD